MVHSMTGFAAAKGQAAGFSWSWDLRAVNGRGLDLRLRLPDWIEGLEPLVRAALSANIGRGNVTLNLRLARDDAGSQPGLNPEALEQVLTALHQIRDAANRKGIELLPASAADVMAQRGVMDGPREEADGAALLTALKKELPDLIIAFNEMRASEGQALKLVLLNQVARIETLSVRATALAAERRQMLGARLREHLTRALGALSEADPDRVAQELALLAVKADITEELDRLHAHVAAARALLKAEGPVGRKLDFLTQEFNREANTLCSKAGSAALTAIGLDLKAVIDQMREQVQNVE
ncbi:YicC/YloC family endoribonuclease [Candidatus Halocynthiibacter alkanivorans]|uniref:YicC/YloC family endoribonuclease n=1 Tax=Candidatus Halocynthiibacter alkanivorans TaxID=2267619 RepID=UPI000DF45D04|nr:YicC/YloC family endoribonuclease [Candidatus Halocynthiibacter alkanivorans]